MSSNRDGDDYNERPRGFIRFKDLLDIVRAMPSENAAVIRGLILGMGYEVHLEDVTEAIKEVRGK